MTESVTRARPVALGLVNGDVPMDPAEFNSDLAASWRERGIACLAVAFPAPSADRSAASMDRLRSILSDARIRVSQYSGVNANLVHPSSEVRDEALRRVKAAVVSAQHIGARVMISGAGTCSADWVANYYKPHPGNFTLEAEDRVVDTLQRIAEVIETTELLYAVECHQLGPMRSPEVIRRILDRVDHPQIVANFDPVNLLDTAYAAFTNAVRIPEMVEIVGPRYAPTCHVKDIEVLDDLPHASREAAPGNGLIDIETIFDAALCLPSDGPVDMIVEHLTAADAVIAFEHVRQRAVARGLHLV